MRTESILSGNCNETRGFCWDFIFCFDEQLEWAGGVRCRALDAAFVNDAVFHKVVNLFELVSLGELTLCLHNGLIGNGTGYNL